MNIPILLYHSVSDSYTKQYRRLNLTPQEFEIHICYLRDHGYQPLTLEHLSRIIRDGNVSFPQKPVVITFDDGLADFLEGAAPILNKYRFPATLFVATSYVGRTALFLSGEWEQERRMLTWDEIRFLCANGIEIGAHSHTHPQLDVMPLLKARDEISSSKDVLEQKLGIPINTFSFPYGYHSEALLQIVRQLGFDTSCIVGHAMATHKDNLFALPRIIITPDVTLQTLEKYLNGVALRKRGAWREILRRGWQMYRFIKGQPHDFAGQYL